MRRRDPPDPHTVAPPEGFVSVPRIVPAGVDVAVGVGRVRAGLAARDSAQRGHGRAARRC